MSKDFKIVLSNGKTVSPDQYVDSRRWLINNNLITDSIKNDLFVLATVIDTKILAISLDINFKSKMIDYVIYTDSITMFRYRVAKKLRSNKVLYYLLCKRLRVFEDIDGHEDMLNNNLALTLGPSWKASLRFIHISSYGRIENNEGPEKISFV